MKTLELYHRAWMGRGPVTAAREAKKALEEIDDTCALVALILLGSGMLSPLQLRTARMLCSDIDTDDQPLRLFLMSMFAHLGHGNIHLRYDPDTVENRLLAPALELLQARQAGLPDCEEILTYARDNWDSLRGKVREMVESFVPTAEAYPIIAESLDRPRPIVKQADTYYFQKYLRAEQHIISSIDTRFVARVPADQDPRIASILTEVFDTSPLRNHGKAVAPDARQQAAAALSLLNMTTVISGGPGTGKTSVALQVLRCFNRLWLDLQPDHIALAAPTGRAAARMQESVQESVEGLRDYLQHDTGNEQTAALQRDLTLKGIQGYTVHRLLRYNPETATFRHDQYNRLPHRVIVVDEVSMLDVYLFSRLLHALHEDTVLILLGDHNQLPSVEAGAVLGDLSRTFYVNGNRSLSPDMHRRLTGLISGGLDSDIVYDRAHQLRDYMVVLTDSHRSVDSINKVGKLINAGAPAARGAIAQNEPVDARTHSWPVPRQSDMAGNEPGEWEGIRFVHPEPDAQSATETIVDSWIRWHYLEHTLATGSADPPFAPLARQTGYAEALTRLTECVSRRENRPLMGPLTENEVPLASAVFAYLHQARILCFARHGDRGTHAINRRANELIRPVLDPRGTAPHFHGMPLIVVRNDYGLELFNGDTGVVLKIGPGYFGLFRRGGVFKLVPTYRLPAFEPAFAMTVHKSQGSEFDMVLLMVPDTTGPLMTREILYTAVTRARYFVGISATPESLDTCIAKTMKRDSGIRKHLDREE